MATRRGGAQISPEDQELLNKLGQAIAQARADSGLNQTTVAELCGIDRSYYSEIERGKRNPTIIVVVQIARVLHTRLDELIKGVA